MKKQGISTLLVERSAWIEEAICFSYDKKWKITVFATDLHSIVIRRIEQLKSLFIIIIFSLLRNPRTLNVFDIR